MKKSKSSRQSDILTQIAQSPSLRVAELASQLGVSTETIRRDLDELTEQKLVNRTYGGAVRALSTEPSVGDRHFMFVDERERIARVASSRIVPGSLVMIGSGATTTHVARRIAIEHHNLTVITHAFSVATALAVNPTINVMMAPGTYLAREGATVGVHAARFFESFSADVAIVGASGLTSDGVSDALIETAAIYGTIASRAAETVVVADRSKFDQLFPARYARWRDLSALISDGEPAGPLAEALDRDSVEVVAA